MAKSAKPAAVMGSLVNLKNVATHKCIALTIHIPAENAQAVLAAFGWPTMVDPVPVAVARLEESASVAKPPPKKVIYGAGVYVEGSDEPRPKDVLHALEETAEEANRKLAASIDAKTRKLNAMGEVLSEEPPPPTRLRHWSEMTPAQQTGVIRNEPDFWTFACVSSTDEARDYIRRWCGVQSCADIFTGTVKAARWAQLQVRYGNWLRQRRGAA